MKKPKAPKIPALPPPPTPAPPPPPPSEDPELKAKRDEAAAAEKTKLQNRRGSSRTIATSPMGVLGAAPTNAPGLKGYLGGAQS